MDLKSNKYIKPAAGVAVAAAAAGIIFALGGFSGGPPGGGGPGAGGGMPAGAARPGTQSAAISVNVTYPERETLERKTDFAGRIEASQTVKVYPEASGTVAKTYFNAGDYVKKGDLLFELDSEDALVALQKAELAYQSTINDLNKAETGSLSLLTELDYQTKINSAQNSYQRARDNLEAAEVDFDFSKFRKVRQNLKDFEAAYDADQSEENWESYIAALKKYDTFVDDYLDYAANKSLVTTFENAYDSYMQVVEQYEIYLSTTLGEESAARDIKRTQAELTLSDAKKAVEDRKVYAPVSGVISAKSINDYDVVGTNTAACSIAQDGMPSVSFNLSEDGANAMDIGTPVTVRYNGRDYSAEVTELAPEASSTTGLYPAKAQLTEDIGTNRSGSVIKVTAVTAVERDTLTISLDNIYYDGNQAYVYVYDNGVARRVDVTVGMTTVDKVSLTEGVTDTDAIITTWHPRLEDGAAVKQAGSDSAEN